MQLRLLLILLTAWMVLASQDYAMDADFQTMLRDTIHSREDEVSATIALFEQFPAARSCVQAAAVELHGECGGALDRLSGSGPPPSDFYLAAVKDEFTLRLALCEITSAQTAPPQHCQHFVPSDTACSKRSWTPWRSSEYQKPRLPCYSQATQKDFQRCLKTLNQHPQYWTSYSNAGVKAATLCKAAHHAIEREVTIQHFKNMTIVAFGMQAGLHSVNSSFEYLQRRMEETDTTIKHILEALRREGEERKASTERDMVLQREQRQAQQFAMEAMHATAIDTVATQEARFREAMDRFRTNVVDAFEKGQKDAVAGFVNGIKGTLEEYNKEAVQLSADFSSKIRSQQDVTILGMQIKHAALMKQVDDMSLGFGNVQRAFTEISTVMLDVSQTVNNTRDVTYEVHDKVLELNVGVDTAGQKVESLNDGIEKLESTLEVVNSVRLWWDRVIILVLLIIMVIMAILLLLMRVRPVFIFLFLLLGLLAVHGFGNHNVPQSPDTAAAGLAMNAETPISLLDHIWPTPTAIFIIIAVFSFVGAIYLTEINKFLERFSDRPQDLSLT